MATSKGPGCHFPPGHLGSIVKGLLRAATVIKSPWTRSQSTVGTGSFCEILPEHTLEAVRESHVSLSVLGCDLSLRTNSIVYTVPHRAHTKQLHALGLKGHRLWEFNREVRVLMGPRSTCEPGGKGKAVFGACCVEPAWSETHGNCHSTGKCSRLLQTPAPAILSTEGGANKNTTCWAPVAHTCNPSY
jgi:hypothetical protein